MLLKSHRHLGFALVLGLLLSAPAAEAAKKIKPGWNLFSPKQDVQLGREAAKDIEKQVEVVNDPQLTNYVAGIGNRLADIAQGEEYPYSFKVVADPSINAFALPGGPIYVHSGLIAAADNEAQLAGVMAHEVSHVALRHSTSRASKASAFQIPLVLAAGTLNKKGGLLGALSGIGLSFGLNSLFLKYSRSAEKNADLLGARMLSEVGYEPVEMANFFQKLQQQSGGRGGPQFFSDHPNPGNRVRYVTEEVRDLPVKRYTRGDTKQFKEMKARASRIQPTKKKPEAEDGSAVQSPGTDQAPAAKNAGFRVYQTTNYRVEHPAEWKVYEAGEGAVTAAPADGIVHDRQGNPALARGLMAGFFAGRERGLSSATDELIADLRRSNPGLEILRGQRQGTQLGGRPAESVLLEGASALAGQREFVWLVTGEAKGGLFYAILVSPENEYGRLRDPYQKIVQSVRFQ